MNSAAGSPAGEGDDVIGFLLSHASGCHDCEGHSNEPEDPLADQSIRGHHRYYDHYLRAPSR